MAVVALINLWTECLSVCSSPSPPANCEKGHGIGIELVNVVYEHFTPKEADIESGPL
jgi:hypothetical protein